MNNMFIEKKDTKEIIYPKLEEKIKKSENLFIVDTKNEYLNKYERIFKENNYNIIVFDLKDYNKIIFDPLKYITKIMENDLNKAIEYLSGIASTIFRKDDFWDNSSRNLFIGCALKLYETNEKINFKNIYDLAQTNIELDNNKSYIYLNGIISAPQETKGGILSTFNQRMIDLIIYDSFEDKIMEIDKIDEPTVIFCEVRKETNYLNEISSMFIFEIFKIWFDNYQSNLTFILDNFEVLGFIPDLVNMLNADERIRFIIATKLKQEFINTYGKNVYALCDVIED